MGDYRSLEVWQKAHQLTLAVYKNTEQLPKTEIYGLTSQTRRSAASIPANIVEGCGRNSDAELARFCRIALGSANELDYHLLLACDLGFARETGSGAIGWRGSNHQADARQLHRNAVSR